MIHPIAKVRLLLLLLALAVGTTVAYGQSSASFDLSWHVVGNGGGVSTSASYRVHGTAGQGIADPATAGSANYRLSSGFWVADAGTRGYLPAILKR